jgi:hypothetical protein
MESRRRTSILLAGATGALLMVVGSAATADAATVQT